VIKLRTKTRI